MMPLLDTLIARLTSRPEPLAAAPSTGPPFDDVLRDASNIASPQNPASFSNPDDEASVAIDYVAPSEPVEQVPIVPTAAVFTSETLAFTSEALPVITSALPVAEAPARAGEPALQATEVAPVQPSLAPSALLPSPRAPLPELHTSAQAPQSQSANSPLDASLMAVEAEVDALATPRQPQARIAAQGVPVIRSQTSREVLLSIAPAPRLDASLTPSREAEPTHIARPSLALVTDEVESARNRPVLPRSVQTLSRQVAQRTETNPLTPQTQTEGMRARQPIGMAHGMEIESISPSTPLVSQTPETRAAAPPDAVQMNSARPAAGMTLSTLAARTASVSAPLAGTPPASLPAAELAMPKAPYQPLATQENALPAPIASPSPEAAVPTSGLDAVRPSVQPIPEIVESAVRVTEASPATLDPAPTDLDAPEPTPASARPPSSSERPAAAEPIGREASRSIAVNRAIPTERVAPTARIASGLETEPLVTSEAVRQRVNAETVHSTARSRPSRSEPLVTRAGETSDVEEATLPAPNRARSVDPAPRASDIAQRRAPDETPEAPVTLASVPRLGTAPPLPVAVSAVEDPMTMVDGLVPTVEPLTPTTLHQLDARTSLADDAVRPAAPPVPARLAMQVWLERLTPASERHVQVSLGDDGSVRLQTLRRADGITVQIHFSDPELQALAGVHADRLRSALEAHFAEPVRLSLSDGLTSDAGTSGSGTSDPGFTGSRPHHAGQSSESRRTRASGSDLPSQTPTRSPLNGRREWVG